MARIREGNSCQPHQNGSSALLCPLPYWDVQVCVLGGNQMLQEEELPRNSQRNRTKPLYLSTEPNVLYHRVHLEQSYWLWYYLILTVMVPDSGHTNIVPKSWVTRNVQLRSLQLWLKICLPENMIVIRPSNDFCFKKYWAIETIFFDKHETIRSLWNTRLMIAHQFNCEYHIVNADVQVNDIIMCNEASLSIDGSMTEFDDTYDLEQDLSDQ
jgi:hypothetical protein